MQIKGQNVATQVPQQPGHNGANFTCANHPHSLACEIEAHQTRQGEVPVTYAVVGARDLAIESQNER